MAGNDDDLRFWLRLERTPGVGPDTARKLLQAFGLPANIFSAGAPALAPLVSQRVAQALLAAPPDQTQAYIEHAQQWAAQPGNRIITLGDADYPPSLLEIADPPLILYVKGRLELLSRPAIAIVGSRNATAQGVDNAEQFARALSQAGMTIISGLALGIDTAAHQGALRDADERQCGATVAVIGTGIDIVYPARNRTLAHRIAEAGCIVSEYALGTPAIASNFPRRNRIISGLARGVLVIEAAAQSGSLITARMAAEQGRDVFAIPGSIHSPLAKGCHQLIKQGAKLVESAQDILEEYGAWRAAASAANPVSSQADAPGANSPLWAALGFDPVDGDTIIQRSGLTAAELHAQLLTLELDGLIERLPGEVYRRLR